MDKYLEKGWIRPSCSTYGAPIVFIRKNTGKLRMMVDYRALNRQTKKDVYPLPRINDLLDKLSQATCLSAIDLASGYHQVRLAPGDCEKTTFITRYGLFEYTVLPLGLCNAPSTFQCLINSVMHGSLTSSFWCILTMSQYIATMRMSTKLCYRKYLQHA